MEIRDIPLAEIKPYEKNPRMNDSAVDAVAESIKAYGFKVPLVLDKNGVIVCGHTRYKAAQKLGYTSCPCIVADDLTEKQVKAFRLADNKVSDFSIWDNKLLLEELDGIDDDLFTGFEYSDVFDRTLDEKDASPLDDNEYGVTYEVVFRSENSDKIEHIKAIWEGMTNAEG